MPCTMTGSLEGDARLVAEQSAEENAKMATGLTAMLCEACELLEQNGQLNQLSPDTLAWWEEHKQVDAKRIANALAEMEDVEKDINSIREALKHVDDSHLQSRLDDLVSRHAKLQLEVEG